MPPHIPDNSEHLVNVLMRPGEVLEVGIFCLHLDKIVIHQEDHDVCQEDRGSRQAVPQVVTVDKTTDTTAVQAARL